VSGSIVIRPPAPAVTERTPREMNIPPMIAQPRRKRAYTKAALNARPQVTMIVTVMTNFKEVCTRFS